MGKMGAAKGVPGMKRRGHPIAASAKPGKKPVVPTVNMPGRPAAVKAIGRLGSSPLAAITTGAGAHGPGAKALPQGAPPGFKKGGRCR